MSTTPAKKPLHIYYVFDFPETQDTEVLKLALSVCLKTKCMDRDIRVFERVDASCVAPKERNERDVMKRGLYVMMNLYRVLKLKTAEDVWFIYAGTGNISGVKPDVSVFLLNRCPGVKECFYIVNKKRLRVDPSVRKEQKLQDVKVFTKSVSEILSFEPNCTSNIVKFSGLVSDLQV